MKKKYIFIIITILLLIGVFALVVYSTKNKNIEVINSQENNIIFSSENITIINESVEEQDNNNVTNNLIENNVENTITENESNNITETNEKKQSNTSETETSETKKKAKQKIKTQKQNNNKVKATKINKNQSKTKKVTKKKTNKTNNKQTKTKKQDKIYCSEGGKTHLAGDGANEHGYYNTWDEAFSAFEKYAKGKDATNYAIRVCPGCGKYYFWVI